MAQLNNPEQHSSFGDTDFHQESFFVISDETGDIVEQDLYEQGKFPKVSIIERAIHLHNVLGLADEVNIRRAFVDDVSQKRPEVVRRRYGKNADQVVAGAEANADKLFNKARMEFSRAFGYLEVQQGGEIPQSRLDRGLAREFNKFWSRFGVPSKVTERKDKKEQLEAIITGFQQTVSEDNRAKGERPHKELAAKDDRSQLGTISRLKAIQGDERAGYLPPTHLEKNMVLQFLDYQDNPKYDFGIRDQLLEVAYSHLGKHGAVVGGELALQAMSSIVYQIEDMLKNATEQLAHLRELEALIQDCPNPAVTLEEEIGLTHPGYAPLVRYIDLAELRDKGRVAGLPRDPLRTYRNEEDVEPELEDKNKIQEDQYTRHELRPLFVKRIKKFPENTTIGAMRKVIGEAITNEAKRAFYMHSRLQELDKPDKGGPLERASRVARFALQRLAS